MIDHSRKLIFVHIARTGGTSIEAALMGRDWWEIDPATKHLSASQTRRLYGEDFWSRYCTFSVVRNPWDRLVSMWATGWWQAAAASGGSTQAPSMHPGATHGLAMIADRRESTSGGSEPTGRQRPPLREFLQALRPHPDERYNTLHYHQILDEPVQRILRFERLGEDFARLLADLGLPPVALPHHERRDRGDYRAYYDDATRRLVAEMFAEDLRRFRYEF